MATRGNVEFHFSRGAPIYFYQHWDGYELPEKVAKALARSEARWDDESYLARVIFSEMIKEDIEGITGYGISPYIGDGDVFVVIDAPNQKANGVSFREFIKSPFEMPA